MAEEQFGSDGLSIFGCTPKDPSKEPMVVLGFMRDGAFEGQSFVLMPLEYARAVANRIVVEAEAAEQGLRQSLQSALPN